MQQRSWAGEETYTLNVRITLPPYYITERERERKGKKKEKETKTESTENPTRWSKGSLSEHVFLFYLICNCTPSISLLLPFLVSHRRCEKTPQLAAVSKPVELNLSHPMPSVLPVAAVYLPQCTFLEVMDC